MDPRGRRTWRSVALRSRATASRGFAQSSSAARTGQPQPNHTCLATARPASGASGPPAGAVGALGRYHDEGQLRCQDGRICPRLSEVLPSGTLGGRVDGLMG